MPSEDICLVHPDTLPRRAPHFLVFSRLPQPYFLAVPRSGETRARLKQGKFSRFRCRMSRDAQLVVTAMDSALSSAPGTPLPKRSPAVSSRMQYRSRPVSVAVDPVSLVISECIAITSAVQKHARSPYSSVSAILGGSPNLIQLVPPGGPGARRHSRNTGADSNADGANDLAANRWGLRGKKGKSMQDNPLIAGFGRLRQELTGVRGMPWAGHWAFMVFSSIHTDMSRYS